jgi:hypothetical protein
MISNFLAALGGAAGGLSQGLQVRQAMKMQQDEAEARRKSDALRETLSMLAARDTYGLVPEAQASQEQATGRLGDMLRSLKIPGLNAPRDMAQGATMDAGPEMPDTRPRVAMGGQSFVVDPTRSAAGRARAERLEDYGRVRGDTLADQQAAAQRAQAATDAENRRAFATFSTAFPQQAGTYRPDIDYGALMKRSDARDMQDRGFRQAQSLQAQRAAADAASVGQGGRAIPLGALKPMIENQTALSRVGQALSAVANNGDALGPSNIGPGAWIKNNVLGASGDDVATRAAIADIGSQIIHDRSGAAVTVSEYPRLAPFVPSPSDRPDVARAKLTRLRALIAEEAMLYEQNFGPDQGYMPFRGAARTGPAPNVGNDRPPLSNFMRP